jgi:hypothetical protein
MTPGDFSTFLATEPPARCPFHGKDGCDFKLLEIKIGQHSGKL